MIVQGRSKYKVGGSLGYKHPFYVKREADEELIEALMKGEFCYVLASRQMGKSSLRVQMLHELRQKGMHCASIDLTSMGSSINQQQWYITELSGSCSSNLNLKKK